jgi:hypothetical protein
LSLVILLVYIHVHYSKYNLYLKDPKIYHARPSAHARLCMLFLSLLKLILSFWDSIRLAGNKAHINSTHLITYSVAHATRKPPRPANLSERGVIRQNSSITQVMQEEADQVIPLLTPWHNLCTNISRIVNRKHMPNA